MDKMIQQLKKKINDKDKDVQMLKAQLGDNSIRKSTN
jgi:hypothetical protein